MPRDLNSKDGRINAFFDFNEPCFFEQCENLRAEYTNEENQLKAQGKCSNCSKNALIGKYVQKIINLV